MTNDSQELIGCEAETGMCAHPGCAAEVTHVHTTWAAAREPWAEYYCPRHAPADAVSIPDALAEAGAG